MVNLSVITNYLVNKFLIPFISSFIGFQIKNINSVRKYTGRFSKFKMAIGSSFIIAIIVGAILQYIQADISIIICISALAGTCGGEILEFVSKPSGVKLIILTLGNLFTDIGGIIKAYKTAQNNQINNTDSDKISEKEEDTDGKDDDSS